MKLHHLYVATLAVALLAPTGVRADETAQVVAKHIRVLEDGTEREQLDALAALGEIGPGASAAVPAVLALLNGDFLYLRVLAASSLRKIGATAEQAVPALTQLLDDDDETLRRMAVRLLGEYRGAPRLITPALVKALGDESEAVRTGALLQIQTTDVDAKLAVPALLRCFESGQDDVRLPAGSTLWRFNPIPAELLPRLIRLLDDEDHEIREKAVQCLEWIDGEWEDAVAPVAKRLEDNSPRVRIAAAFRLALWERRQADALRVALALANRPNCDPEVREDAILVLGRLPNDSQGRRLKAIVGALSDKVAGVRSAAAVSLRWVKEMPKEAIPLLNEALVDPDDWTRLWAAWALGVHGVQIDVVVGVLVDLLGSEQLSAPATAARALGEIGPPARAAIPALEGLQSTESESMREVVTKALRAIRADEE